jgi:hypothetical protein
MKLIELVCEIQTISSAFSETNELSHNIFIDQ